MRSARAGGCVFHLLQVHSVLIIPPSEVTPLPLLFCLKPRTDCAGQGPISSLFIRFSAGLFALLHSWRPLILLASGKQSPSDFLYFPLNRISGMPHSQPAFEDVPNVSDDANQILRSIFQGLEMCKTGITLPSLSDQTFITLFDLEERLMRWAGAQQSAKNNGFQVWHAKYLAGCCFLVGGEIAGHRKTGNVQTTTRTTRCAVSMINEIVKGIHGVCGAGAFAVLPALASKSSRQSP